MDGKSRQALLATLQARFEARQARHPGLRWAEVLARLEGQFAALKALAWMEATGGEPDVVACDRGTGLCTFVDCAAESPGGRRSLCYDEDALAARKENKPAGSALGLAGKYGLRLLDEAGYRALQALGPVDQKTSSWLATPPAIRALGGALFGDHRYGQVFVYHNGAQSYYAARGFRAALQV